MYLAENIKTKESVAIKAMKHEFFGEEECSQLREINALEKCKHPQIINLIESIMQKNKLYLVFEYMDDNLYDHYLNNPVYHQHPKNIDNTAIPKLKER